MRIADISAFQKIAHAEGQRPRSLLSIYLEGLAVSTRHWKLDDMSSSAERVEKKGLKQRHKLAIHKSAS
jgi:hypothetical protein